MTNVVETEPLTQRFGHTEAISELSFQVPGGSVYDLLGPNGAGQPSGMPPRTRAQSALVMLRSTKGGNG